MISRPVPARFDIGVLDHVVVQTDAGGRFRAECLRGRGYSVWAHWPDGDVQMMTAVAENVVPGPPVRLHEAEPFAAPKLTFGGFEAWADEAPLTVVASCYTRNGYRATLEVVDGSATMPMLPGFAWKIEVRGKTGLLLVRKRVARGVETEVAVPEPVAVEVRCRDGAGEPVAGASLASMPSYSAGGRDPSVTSVRVAETDAEGVARFRLPSVNALTGRTGTQLLRIEKRGYASMLQVVPARGRRIANAVLADGYAVRGRLRDAEGKPMAGVAVYFDHPIGLGGSGDARFGAPLQMVRTDDQGRFVEHGCSPQSGCRVLLVLSPSEARRFGFAAETDRSLAPVLWVAACAQVGKDVDLGEIAMDEVAMCRLQVVDHQGLPATDARVRLIHESGFDAIVDFVTDRVGRLQFAYPDDATRAGVYVKGGGVGLMALPAGGAEMRLSLLETRAVEGRVLLEDGKPAAGAVVLASGPRQGMSFELGQLVGSALAQSWTADDDGRFVVTLPMTDTAFELRARWRPPVGAPIPRISPMELVEPDDEVVELVVR
ncbi:MAG: hypothetical protein ACE37K_11385 [Planctomycetota bacterium]